MSKARISDPTGVYEQYQRGVNQKQEIGLFDTVRENEGMYLGDQWNGVNAPGLEKPVLNFIGRVVDYQVAMLASKAISASVSVFNAVEDDTTKQTMSIIAAQIDQFIEDNDLSGLSKDFLRDAAVCGDCCAHLWFDAAAPTGQTAEGLVKCEIVENTAVVFANPQSADVQSQAYIILMARRPVDEVRQAAIDNGMDEDTAEQIKPDSSNDDMREFVGDDDMVTVYTKYWREEGTVRYCKVTHTETIKETTDTGYKRYPIAWMRWKAVRGSCHGRAAVTGLIPNQIAINKMYAMGIKQQRENAFRKILFDRAKFPNGWSNKIGAVGVNGDPREAATSVSTSADIPESLIPFASSLMTNTRDLMGASDAALGNVNPDNTSAIIVTQEATAVPLESVRRAYYVFVEDVIRNALDIISTDYGVREVVVTDALGKQSMAVYDFAHVRDMILRLKIDIGQTSFWDADQQVQTIDNLFSAGIIRDPIIYLEQIPENKLKNKNRLIAQLKNLQTPAVPVPAKGGM